MEEGREEECPGKSLALSLLIRCYNGPVKDQCGRPFDLGEIEVRAVSLLRSCFILCTFLVVKRLRGRPNMPHIE